MTLPWTFGETARWPYLLSLCGLLASCAGARGSDAPPAADVKSPSAAPFDGQSSEKPNVALDVRSPDRLEGRGWSSAKSGVALESSSVADADEITVPVSGAAPARCWVFLSPPSTLAAALVAVDGRLAQASLSRLYVEEFQQRPLLTLGFSLRSSQPGSASTPEDAVVLLEHERIVLCLQERPLGDGSLRSALREFFHGFEWDEPSPRISFSEIEAVFMSEPVTVYSRFKEPKVVTRQHMTGFGWTTISTSREDGRRTVRTRALQVRRSESIATFLETFSSEAVDPNGSLEQKEWRRVMGTQIEGRVTLHRTGPGGYRYEHRLLGQERKGEFRASPELSSSLVKHSRLADRGATSDAFDIRLNEYQPAVAVERATPVRLARKAGDPPSTVQLTYGSFQLVATYGEDGRFDAADLSGPTGKFSTQRSYATGLRPPK